jgi:hypothetical protein
VVGEAGHDRLRSMIVNIVHHVVAASASLMCFWNPQFIFPYVFYGGFSEVSTLFLTVIEYIRARNIAVHASTWTYFAYLILLSCFASSFILFRVVLWTYVTWLNRWNIWNDDSLLPIFFVVLTLLQYFWACKIVIKVKKKATKAIEKVH